MIYTLRKFIIKLKYRKMSSTKLLGLKTIKLKTPECVKTDQLKGILGPLMVIPIEGLRGKRALGLFIKS